MCVWLKEKVGTNEAKIWIGIYYINMYVYYSVAAHAHAHAHVVIYVHM